VGSLASGHAEKGELSPSAVHVREASEKNLWIKRKKIQVGN
jgi:hypothetical protein